MSQKSIDGVDVMQVSEAQLAGYARAAEKIQAFDAPRVFDKSDPKARLFVALFDGTGNDVIKDPQHITNVGRLKKQIEDLSDDNPAIRSFYKEGPGTQGGLKGVIDGALGGTYQERIEAVYDKFNEQARAWLKEDPDAKISVVSVGFSRGAEQAAGFSRVVDQRGVQGINADSPRVAPGSTPQVLALYDPVGTGEPARHDRRPPPSVVSGLQIRAEDEQRALFPSTTLMAQGKSEDGRFLGVSTAGAHSDIGGGYLIDGLPRRNFNLMADYLNKVMGSDSIKKVEVLNAPEKNVIHDSTQHQWFYRKVEERGIIDKLEPSGKLPVEPANPDVLGKVKPHDPRAASFASDAPEIALKKYPELAGAYAAVAAVDRQAQKDGMSQQQRELVTAYVHQQTLKSIERGEIPAVQVRERVQVPQERPQGLER